LGSCSTAREDFFTTDGQTDANGNAEIEIPIKKGGSLHATVTAVTPENRTLQETAYIWVPDKEWYWLGAEQERIQIIPDQRAYKPGDTAKVMIMAGQNPVSILVTSEGVGLLNRQVVRNQGGPVMVEVPIRAENAPNFYLTATFLKDDKLHKGSKSLAVPADALKLNVQLQSSKPQFQPGEAASYTIIAKDAQGKPASAEFSVGVVDEAIYAIRPEAATDILKFSYGRSSTMSTPTVR
jgi:alpha-2-macroglobulin